MGEGGRRTGSVKVGDDRHESDRLRMKSITAVDLLGRGHEIFTPGSGILRECDVEAGCTAVLLIHLAWLVMMARDDGIQLHTGRGRVRLLFREPLGRT